MDFKEAYHDTCSTVAIAARSGNLQMVKKLIKKGKSTDVKDNRGWIALHEAAYNGHSRCLQELLQQNIEVDMRTFEVETALILASRRGQVKCVRYLLKAGADANAQTNEGFSPLWEACQSGSLECVQLLLNAHAHVNHQMYTDDTPLHVIIQMHGDVDIVLSLLEARADIRMKTENGHTPLFVAAQFGRQECLKILIEHSKSKGLKFLKQYVNTPASDNASPLYIAAQENNAECCDLLLKYGADPHHHISLSPSIKSYPLQIAIFKNNLRCMDILIKGTDRVKFQFTEKHIKTFEDKYKNMFECWKFHPLILAMEHNDGKCFNCLLRNGYGDLFQSPFTPDLFQYALRLRPVVILVKHYETWLRERFASAQFDIYKAIIYHYYWTEKMLDIHIFVVLLRLGIITSKYLHCKQVQSCRTFYNDGSYLHLLALYKYFSNDHICKPCKRANRSSCIEQLHILGWSPVGVLTRMCLVPNLWRCNVDDWVEYICGEHDVGIGMKYDSDDDSDEAQTNEITVISKMYHIEAACSNLQHMCRATVVYRLMGNNNYSREAISSLAVPKMLQNYLMYSEYGSVSRSLLRGFQKLRLVEKTIDKVFEETENVQ